ncbi:hypothetical protein SKAU_G00209970 [Synaphobranchus kaupii]|uniref:DUF6729 domain-containing protein n=1 Tax=Synaphobranchus kaupii TaxID=118154 RepID=A0A9Q1IST3_SYNKA|nr:hypothetical protein SKAU_G00209970 [Synaphobranchus kaupii]
MKRLTFFPGRMKVCFRRGASGFLRQDPSDQAKRIKDNPALQDKSPPQKEELVKNNARTVVLQRGGDLSDKQEVLGEYIIQFRKYKGKSFRWLLENDVGYTLYLIKKVDQEEKAGVFKPEGHSKASLLSFLEYSRSHQEIEDLLKYVSSQQPPALTPSSEDDNLVSFGTRAKDTWRGIWDSRADGFAAFVMGKECIPNSRMDKLKKYLMKQQALLDSAIPPAIPVMMSPTRTASSTIASVLPVMEEDEELERLMLSLSPSRFLSQPSPPSHDVRPPAAIPPSAPAQPGAAIPGYDQEFTRWRCSLQQSVWMKTELESLGLWPGSRPVRHPMNMVSLWRHPPQPEIIETTSELPSPKYFQLHPFFIWKPEHTIMQRLRNNYVLPCLHNCPNPQVASAGVGRPRVIIGTSGQYYILASRLTCKVCKRNWFADKAEWLEKLPRRLVNIMPALLTHKKAICKTVMDELRRSSRSPNDMANQLTEMLHLKFERAHLAYLHSINNIRDAEAGLYGQRTITGFLRQDDTPAPFGGYEDADGWCGVSVSPHYLVECLLQEHKRQEPALTKLLQGTFGQVFRADHTRRVARKVVLASGTMSSYAVMNENWMILSWAMLQSECDRSLEPMYEGLARRYSAAGIEKAGYQWVDRDCCATFRVMEPGPQEHLLWEFWKTTEAIVAEVTSGNLANTCASRSKYNIDITVKLDLFHCIRRFSRECVSEHHPLYSSFCQFLSAAFTVVDQSDLQRLKEVYTFCGIVPANPTKQHIKEHCRAKVPQPRELVQRVEDVLHHFHLAKDPNDVFLFKPSMLKLWRIQRVHILRGCLSDPEVGEGILYRYGGTQQLNHTKGDGATVPIWIPVRGTSQQEGFHFHQARCVTGNRVSTELFQAQGMNGVARWNFQRLVDLKQPDVVLPSVFDPVLTAELNMASEKVTGEPKYPVLQISTRDTGERFGLQYTEPGCRPVPLNWDKNHTQKDANPEVVGTQQSSQQSSAPDVIHCPTAVAAAEGGISQERTVTWDPSPLFAETHPAPAAQVLPPQQFSPSTVLFHPPLAPPPTTPKVGGLVESLINIDLPSTPPLPLSASPQATRTGPIKAGGLIFVLDHSRWTEPMRAAIDGLLAKHHGAKDILKWVDADYAALVHSTCADPNSLLHPTTRQHISRYVKHLAKLKNTSSSLNTSPEKLLETQQLWQRLTAESQTISVTTLPAAPVNPPALDSPMTQATVERMSGSVKYFYCSTKVFKTYAAEGLTDPRMSFQDFAATAFFQRELDAVKQRGAEWKRVKEERAKRKSAGPQPSGPRCRFCHMPLKQGSGPHVHTYFPGVAGKYVYCPSRVLSLYKPQGMQKEMSWREFQQSAFYEVEKQRWTVEKGK